MVLWLGWVSNQGSIINQQQDVRFHKHVYPRALLWSSAGIDFELGIYKRSTFDSVWTGFRTWSQQTSGHRTFGFTVHILHSLLGSLAEVDLYPGINKQSTTGLSFIQHEYHVYSLNLLLGWISNKGSMNDQPQDFRFYRLILQALLDTLADLDFDPGINKQLSSCLLVPQHAYEVHSVFFG